MKITQRILGVLALILVIGIVDASAQYGLGISYERRNDTPTNGFGLQLERELLGSIPLLSLKARLHGSYFSEESDFRGAGVQFNRATIESYDFGVAALGGVNLGLFRPYVGLGLGTENWEYDDGNSNTSYYYGIAGLAITPIPMLKPYIEYRVSGYNDISEARKEIGEGAARFHIGITLSF
ncbi:MAG: hypothetical protein LAT57_11610 [Balneolales bacterium]|nr:hypothetical protein [Balneolales bacterium]